MRSWQPTYHSGLVRRAALAAAVSCAVHAAIVVILALPTARYVASARPARVRFWEGHTGRYGPMQLMPEISLSRDDDPVNRPAQAPRGNTKVRTNVARSTPSTPATASAATPAEMPHAGPLNVEPVPDAQKPDQQMGAAAMVATELPGPPAPGLVELKRGGQTSTDFVLAEFVRPSYPEGVPQTLLARPIVVHVAMYIDPTGAVTQAYVIHGEGGPLFDEAVLAAVRKWKYRPVVVDREPEPFWDQIKVTFIGVRSPDSGTVKVDGG